MQDDLALRAAVTRALAIERLERGSLALAQVAGALGDADQSVFHQALRRWTATTPMAYRG